MEDNSFLGRGWSFPPTFNKSRAEIEMVSKEEDIKQSLEIYFYTKLGERIMRQDYGCVIHEHLFDRIDGSILEILEIELQENIGFIEPRIKVENISISNLSENEGALEVKIDYTIITTNIRDNIVFPFYLNEGTNIKI
jgi:phage baseplate assembly protein W